MLYVLNLLYFEGYVTMVETQQVSNRTECCTMHPPHVRTASETPDIF